jgi:hypothetical protein
MSAAAAGHEVFSFCGHVEGQPATELKTGLLIANTPEEAVTTMRECGFVIKAISSLIEVRQMVDILEKIATKHPDVEPSEFIDTLEGGEAVVPENNVFCFSGNVVNPTGGLKSGFIIASDLQFLTDFLGGLGFVVESATSLSDLRSVMQEMVEVLQASHGDEQYDTHVVNLKAPG